MTRRVSGSVEVGVTTTSQMPASSDRLPLNAPAASAVMLDGAGADGVAGVILTAAPAASVTVKVGVGTVISTALRSRRSPGVAVPDTGTAPVTLASAAGWSRLTATPPTEGLGSTSLTTLTRRHRTPLTRDS